MTTIRAKDVRIPRHAGEAIVRHEEVVVLNRERAVYVIIHPDDREGMARSPRRGRPLREVLSLVAQAGPPDPAFAEDMEAVLDSIGPVPSDPWVPS